MTSYAEKETSLPSIGALVTLFKVGLYVFYQALATFAIATLLGGLLFYVWGPLDSAFSFIGPVSGGYWSYALLAIGVYAVFYILKAAWNGVGFDVEGALQDEDKFLELVHKAITPGMMLLVAWIIFAYIR